jgi:hypothetical protein
MVGGYSDYKYVFLKFSHSDIITKDFAQYIQTQFNSLYMIVNVYLPDDGFISGNI